MGIRLNIHIPIKLPIFAKRNYQTVHTMKKNLPVRSSNYGEMIRRNGYYVDKTHFIPILEKNEYQYVFFLRPRRFGKSFFLSTLEHYYGVQYAEKFDHLFGEYHIGQKQYTTPLKNSYYVLKFNFSAMTGENSQDIRKEFETEIRNQLIRFTDTYSIGTETERTPVISGNSSTEMFRNFMTLFLKYKPDGKIYLMIDEYDHFTNELFSFRRDEFRELVSGTGWVRKFYEVIKQFMGEGVIDRFFATGVTPVTLDSMTSGFNVAQNITLDSAFDSLAGFTEAELTGLIEGTICGDGECDIQSVVKELRHWYNGSRFTPEAGPQLYNPQMVITFLAKFSGSYKFPQEMADINVTSDYKKVSAIVELLPSEERESLINQILSTEEVSSQLTLLYNNELSYDFSQAVSLLFYNGLLTIKSVSFGIYKFVIPNYVIKKIFWEYFAKIHDRRFGNESKMDFIAKALTELTMKGEIDGIVKAVQHTMKKLSYRDIENFSEKHLKMIFLTLLIDNNAWFVKSEPELQNGYADILLKRTALNPGKHDILIELKYVKKTGAEELVKISEKGIMQTIKYSESIKEESAGDLLSFLVIFFDKYNFRIHKIE